MKKSRLVLLSFLMLFALFNTSCKKDIEELDETSQTQESEVVRSVVNSFRNIASQGSNSNTSNVSQTQSAINSYFCFDFVYPISVIYNDGSTQSLADDNEFAQAIVDQTANHYIIDFVYPFDVVQNGQTITINNDIEFENLINSCVTITPITPTQIFCFDFVYPISVEMSDGSVVVVNNDTELDNLFMNATSVFPVDMVYPFDVTQNGQTITINNSVEFNALLDSCYGNGVVTSDLPPTMVFEQCYTLNYPLDVLVDDGTSATTYPVTVHNDAEYNNLIFSTTPVSVVDFVYPISVTDSNGNIQSFNDIYEFTIALYDCYSGGFSPVSYSQLPPSFFYDCVELVYPVTIVMNDGSTQIANNVAEYDSIISNSTDVLYVVDFQYPVDINFNGQTYTVNDFNEIVNYISQCSTTPSSYTASVCFTFNYPITVIDMNGTSHVANNDQELDNIMDNFYPNANQYPWLDPYLINFDFPITVTFNGSQIALNNWTDYYNLINNCNP